MTWLLRRTEDNEQNKLFFRNTDIVFVPHPDTYQSLSATTVVAVLVAHCAETAHRANNYSKSIVIMMRNYCREGEVPNWRSVRHSVDCLAFFMLPASWWDSPLLHAVYSFPCVAAPPSGPMYVLMKSVISWLHNYGRHNKVVVAHHQRKHSQKSHRYANPAF